MGWVASVAVQHYYEPVHDKTYYKTCVQGSILALANLLNAG